MIKSLIHICTVLMSDDMYTDRWCNWFVVLIIAINISAACYCNWGKDFSLFNSRDQCGFGD